MRAGINELKGGVEGLAMQSGHDNAGNINVAREAREKPRAITGEMQPDPAPAVIIMNADDWGLGPQTTRCILDCARAGALSSVSAMVFMEISEEAASLAREHEIDAGLHLNLTTAFTGTRASSQLREHHERVIAYLRRRRLHRAVFNPFLMNSFEYVTKAQIEEFSRLYGSAPRHLDGHHHMHLCMNVLLQQLLPAGALVRRNKSSLAGERGLADRCYRGLRDGLLTRRHCTTDYFFDLVPLEGERLKKIVQLGRQWDVEVAAHPDNEEEYKFLMNDGLAKWVDNVVLSRGYHLRGRAAQLDAQPSSAPVQDARSRANRT